MQGLTIRLVTALALFCSLSVGLALVYAKIARNPVLYFISSREGQYRLYVTDLDHDLTRRVSDQNMTSRSINLSPDSRQIVFGARNGPVYVMDWNGSQMRPLPINQPVSLAWSPDSRYIAYTARQDQQIDIHLVEMAAYTERRLTTSQQNDINPAWSPDGRQIVYISGTGRLQRVPVEATDCEDALCNDMRQHLVENLNRNAMPMWSPDGEWIVFTIGDTKAGRIARVRPDGQGLMILAEANSQLPRWSPDGQRIAFMSNREGYWAVYVMKADGSGQARVSRDTLGVSDLVWSPDGQRIAFLVDVRRSPKLYVVGADGRGERRLFSDIFSYWSPQWWQL